LPERERGGGGDRVGGGKGYEREEVVEMNMI